MGVFSDNRMMAETSGMKQVCKRDYEGEIARLMKHHRASSNLLLAVDEYCDCSYADGDRSVTLNGLIGGLTREIKALNNNITQLQEEWENSK